MTEAGFEPRFASLSAYLLHHYVQNKKKASFGWLFSGCKLATNDWGVTDLRRIRAPCVYLIWFDWFIYYNLFHTYWMPTVCQINGMCKMHIESAFMGLRAHGLVGGKHVNRQCFEVCRVIGAVTAHRGPNSGLRVREDFQKKGRDKLILDGWGRVSQGIETHSGQTEQNMPGSQTELSILGKHIIMAGARCAQWRMPGIELIPSLAVAISGESWDWSDRSFLATCF